MSEKDYSYILSEVIENSLDKFNLDVNNEYIDTLVSKCKNKYFKNDNEFFELIVILFHKTWLKSKIKKITNNSYKNYVSDDDLYSVFYFVLIHCILNFDNECGNFINYFSKMLTVSFNEEQKQSFLKITGHIKSKNKYVETSINNIEISDTTSCDYDDFLMVQQMIHKIKKLPYGDMLLFKYLTGNKPKTNQEVADKFCLTLKQTRTRLSKASQSFVKNNKTFFEDNFYESNDKPLAFFTEFIEKGD